MKIRKSYYNAIKTHGLIGTLNMYRDNKIELNSKEWKNLHKRIDKEHDIYGGFRLSFIINFVLCLGIVMLIAPYMSTANHEKVKYCNKIQGHKCTRYEIEKMDV